jgi:7-cyano-7-deazaguanine synthase
VRAIELEVPFHQTWSCYKGGAFHCGRCATCVERLEAIDEACGRLGLDPADVDQTIYGDRKYWRQAVKEYAAR